MRWLPGCAGVLMALFAAAGCSYATGGTAGVAVESSAVSTAGVAVELPPRPRSFDLDAVDACRLMPADRRIEFRLNRPPLGPDPELDSPGVRQCSIPSSTSASFSVFLDSSGGAADRLAQAGGASVALETLEVNGFSVPLLEGGDGGSCIAVIDTSDEQNLRVQANGTGLLSVAETCEIVTPWVQVVLDTLATMQP